MTESRRDPVWLREDGARFRMRVLPGGDGGDASRLELVPFGAETVARGDVARMRFTLAGSVGRDEYADA
jgi:hypothetical protein